MVILTSISRTLSSGYQSIFTKSFNTLKELADYIQDEWYDAFCEDFDFPQEWDEEDRGCAFPKKEEFTYEALQDKCKNKRRVVLLDAWSTIACLRPNEVILDL